MEFLLNNISVWFDRKKPILSHLNLHFSSWEWITFYGPSGSGKSSLLKTLSCLMSPLSGKYSIDGRDINSLSWTEIRLLRRDLFSYIFAEHFFLETASAKENILLKNHLLSIPYDENHLSYLANTLKIEELLDTPVKELSTWQKERVAIISWLLFPKKVIVIDEPWSSLDDAMKERVHILLQEEQKKGTIILCASHDRTTLHYSTSSYLLENDSIHPFPSEK